VKRLVPKFIKDEVRRHVDCLIEERLQPKTKELSETAEVKVADMEVLLRQTLSILEMEHGFIPPPPKHLQVRVVGGYVPDFISSGLSMYQDLNDALAADGKSLKDFDRILDFGCGCGRAVRALKDLQPKSRFFGLDIDAEAIAWLNGHYAKFGEFFVAPHLPPTGFEDGMFDFIFGVSVFTHLPEDMQFKWLEELKRITKPGGYLILTKHGEKFYRNLDADINAVMDKKGFYYSDFGHNYGASINLPDFYQTAFHSHEYIKREWSKYFNVLDFRVLGMGQHQDTVLLRKRG